MAERTTHRAAGSDALTALPRSTFLDAYANQLATPEQFAALAASTSLATAQAVLGDLYAYAGTPASVQKASSDTTITVGLMLERAQDPTPLLASDWASYMSGQMVNVDGGLCP